MVRVCVCAGLWAHARTDRPTLCWNSNRNLEATLWMLCSASLHTRTKLGIARIIDPS